MISRTLPALIAAFALTACGEMSAPEAPVAPAAIDTAEQALTAFDIDLEGLTKRPSGLLPARTLSAEAWTTDAIRTQLVQTDEAFDVVRDIGSRQIIKAASWRVERDPARGLITVHDQTKKKAAQAPLDAELLQERALLRLEQWGVQPAEVARVLHKPLMRQDREQDGTLSKPAIHRYKTFVWRGLNGIPIEGQRAVITHHPDGSFHRASIAWAPLAVSGHKLKTTLSTEQIRARAVQALQAAGEEGGVATMRWAYVPTLDADGAARLELKALLRLEASEHADHTEEARIFEVSVGAR
jgi:hypothetical protein